MLVGSEVKDESGVGSNSEMKWTVGLQYYFQTFAREQILCSSLPLVQLHVVKSMSWQVEVDLGRMILEIGNHQEALTTLLAKEGILARTASL